MAHKVEMAGIEYHPLNGDAVRNGTRTLLGARSSKWRLRESNIIPWMGTPSETERAPCWVRVRQSGDAGNRISSPERGPRPKRNAHPCWVRVRQSGDAGNRTRVRKNRPSEIYERSRSKVVTAGISSGKNRLRPAALSFAQVAA